MECIPPANPTTSAGSSSKAKKSKEKKGGKQSKGVKLSTDPQSVAARERRHRISDRFKILQSMVPGGSKMDTVSMLEEAIHYVKFLQTQIWLHQNMINSVDDHDQQSPVPMFLPHYFPSEQFNYLQPDTSIDDSPQSLTQLPEAQYCCFQGEVADFDATMKYWPA